MLAMKRGGAIRCLFLKSKIWFRAGIKVGLEECRGKDDLGSCWWRLTDFDVLGRK
jgi:hypothetical protein